MDRCWRWQPGVLELSPAAPVGRSTQQLQTPYNDLPTDGHPPQFGRRRRSPLFGASGRNRRAGRLVQYRQNASRNPCAALRPVAAHRRGEALLPFSLYLAAIRGVTRLSPRGGDERRTLEER
ncbi:hypothetical protein MRX96_044332 [Rhipicephalus microplus]